MPEDFTILLRYSDAEADTIFEHRRCIADCGCTWWGWWKKDFEPAADSILGRLKRGVARGPIRIGLVNRKSRDPLGRAADVYTAVCTAVTYGAEAAPLGSPDPLSTPGYYQQSFCPAWFRLERIDDTSLPEFQREFGEIPPLDPTLYSIRRVSGPEGLTIDVHPKHSWSMQPRIVGGGSILHLSDLHFGDDHAYSVGAARPGFAVRSKTLLDVVLKAVGDSADDIGVIVVSGDLITRANHDFGPAREFLVQLTGSLGLDREDVVIVPGNHDIDLIEVEQATRTYFHERPYRDFLASFYGMKEIHELEGVRRYQTSSGWDLCFIALNSARLRSREAKEYGYVGGHRYEDLIRFILDTLKGANGLAAGRTAIIAVVHHHLLPVDEVVPIQPGRPAGLTVDAGEMLRNFQRAGVGIVLHGHQHLPVIGEVTLSSAHASRLVWRSASEMVFSLGLGTSGSKELNPECPFNTLGIYTPSDGGLDVRIIGYTPTAEPRLISSPNLILPIRHPVSGGTFEKFD